MFVCCECCVLSGRGLCDELITRPEEPYRLWCVVVCDIETSRMRWPWPALGRSATKKKFVPLDIQHAMRVLHVVICGLPSTIFFPHYLINGTNFGGGGGELLNTKCVFWFSLQGLSETFLILRRNERDIIKNIYWSLAKVPLILVRF